ncbi:unnamed protein product [Prunus armeniaca]
MTMVMVMMVCLTAANVARGQPKPGCSGSCGNLTNIPYPFGTSLDCSFDETFVISCNDTTYQNGGHHKQAYFPNSFIPITNISLRDHELRVSGPIARDCYYADNEEYDRHAEVVMRTNSKFPVSSKRNMLVAVGCEAIGAIESPINYDALLNNANLSSSSVGRMRAGCLSLCSQVEEVKNGTCSGAGCCQISIADGVIDYSLMAENLFNHSDFNPCDYSFVVEVGAYSFSSLDLVDLQKRESFPVVLDWAVGNYQSCEQVNDSSTACQSRHSECYNSTNGPGYRCKCLEGFQGNPYLVDGCQDINECEIRNLCVSQATCHNNVGGVECRCPKGYIGDGLTSGKGCILKDDKYLRFAIPMGGLWIYWGLKRRRFMKLKEKFFRQNGGLLLQQQLSDHKGSIEMIKIFTAEELKRATKNYDESMVLGQGSFGTVYKGTLLDNKVVAIKKSKVCDKNQIETFINEMIVLSRVNHRNVVKLLGCCLETEVPLLVYEFITNGTLYSHIHDRSQDSCSALSWQLRLKIATEIAGALAYLHSETCIPIIHRDVKTANILLDEDYIAKMSDFGTSRLIPVDETQLTTLVRGTFGYLDPEYSQSSQLTEKSDVYSFGVVLVELLTAKQVISFARPERERNLAVYFVSQMNADRLLEILDDQVPLNEEIIEQLREVADLASKCLRMRGEERPAMKDVTAELERIMNNLVN